MRVAVWRARRAIEIQRMVVTNDLLFSTFRR
jgi:hypothetical protein